MNRSFDGLKDESEATVFRSTPFYLSWKTKQAGIEARFIGHKYFSGRATYEKTITAPDWKGRQVLLHFGEGTPVSAAERRSGNGMRAMLEGPVREAAVVWVNGKRAGSVWCAPYEVEVTGLLHAGSNTLRIVVVNTAVNLLAKGPLPDYQALTAKYGERFQAQDMNAIAPLPSGLLGPVRLVAR